MDSLTTRAERALLGAILLGAGPALPKLEPGDFADETRRILFTMLTTDPSQVGSAFDREYLGELKRSCPDPRHAPAYARMVIEAALRRQLVGHALRLEHRAGDLHYHARRLNAAARPGDPAQELLTQDVVTGEGRIEHPSVERLLSHELLVSLALRAHVKAFNPDKESAAPDPARPPHPVTPIPSAGVAAWTAAAQPPPPVREVEALLEERVLATVLMQDPQTRAITGWLPAEAFTSGPRRELYTAMIALQARSEPVDELTTDWERARYQAPPADSRAADTSYARRRIQLPTEPAEALGAARRLFRQCLNTQTCSPASLPLAGVIEPASATPSAAAAIAIPLISPPGPARSGPEPRM